MPELSCSWVLALVVVFLFMLARAYYEDYKIEQRRKQEQRECQTCDKIKKFDTSTSEGFHAAVSATVRNEISHGALAKSRVHTLLTNTRDQVIRGAIMGAITGGASDILHNAVTWSLVGGIVSGVGDWLKL